VCVDAAAAVARMMGQHWRQEVAEEDDEDDTDTTKPDESCSRQTEMRWRM
jgi:hypothetical protein